MSDKILIVDDEFSIRDSLEGILSDEGFEPTAVESAEKAFEFLEEDEVDCILLDIWMPGMDGLEALKKIKELYPLLPVIMISGHGNIETAVQATKFGAFDFIEKPPSYDKIVLSIRNALHLYQLAQENLILKEKHPSKQGLTGKSTAIENLREQIDRVAPTDAWVLIRGEHGTGKEVVAQSIHRLSKTAHKPMIEVNCAAIPEELIESELFGHEKGSFTGATTSKRGKFDLADGGILFLDEIADMSLKTQAKILRILQEQKFERVGGAKTINVNVRVLAATNKNLEDEIEKGNFRADLFWRLNVVPIIVPPLRERLDDIPLLVEDLMADFAQKGFKKKTFDNEVVTIMSQHSWPGNVRELRNFLERVAIMCPDEIISKDAIHGALSNINPNETDESLHPTSEMINKDGYVIINPDMNFKEARKYFEKEFLRIQLKSNKGNISQTAEKIGIERSHLHKKIKTLGIEDEL